MSWLATHCPRLAKARDDYNRHYAYQRQIERQRTTALLEAERLVAHRELQLIRAYRTNDARYIKRRGDKLVAARLTVTRLQERTA